MTWPPSAGDAPPPGRGPASKSRVGCAKTVRRRRPPNPTLTSRRCLCCSFLDTVHDVGMREALRTVLEPGNNLVAAPLWCPVSPSPGRHVHIAGSPRRRRDHAHPARRGLHPEAQAVQLAGHRPAAGRLPGPLRGDPAFHPAQATKAARAARASASVTAAHIPLSRARTMPSAPSRVSTTPLRVSPAPMPEHGPG